jgi:predicted short-subunit dehydrogenase-like oxidoreductase (DUF2520 family)
MLKVGFIGAGTTGTALAVRLSQAGCPVVAVFSRSLSSAQKMANLVANCQVCHSSQEVADAAELVFITTPDNAIARVASEVKWHAGQSVVHCSGADSVDILEPAKKLGASVGSFHPLQTFASVNQAVQNLPGSTFALEAREPLLSELKALASLLDGEWVELKPGDKVLYHAAAVFVSNYLVTLVKLALDLWQDFGVSPKEATKALLPLLKGTINNIDNVGLPYCLTGPISRGDSGTISKHLNALAAKNSALLTTYKELGLQTVPIALAKGKIDKHKAEELKALLSHPERSEETKSLGDSLLRS